MPFECHLGMTPRPGLTALLGRKKDSRVFSSLTLVGMREPGDWPAESRRGDMPALRVPVLSSAQDWPSHRIKCFCPRRVRRQVNAMSI